MERGDVQYHGWSPTLGFRYFSVNLNIRNQNKNNQSYFFFYWTTTFVLLKLYCGFSLSIDTVEADTLNPLS